MQCYRAFIFMEPYKKAAQIKQHFCVQAGDITENGQIKSARAYIGQLLNDIPMLEGDFKMAYKHEWWQFTSYWYAVLNAL